MAAFPEDFVLAQRLSSNLGDWYLRQVNENKDVEPMLLVRLMVVALTQYAGILGVDVGMTEEQFLNVCRTQFNEAFQKAPRFG